MEVPRDRPDDRSDRDRVAAAKRERRDRLRGIASMLSAVLCFAIMDALMKALVAQYSAMQVSFLRGITSLPLVLLASVALGQARDLAPRRWAIHLVRGVLGAGS